MLGFLWYNAPPAKYLWEILALFIIGGSLAAVAIIVKHEIVLALWGAFVLETISVIISYIV